MSYRPIKPILFKTEMVRAILDGRKTVTRRVIKSSQMQGIAPDRFERIMIRNSGGANV